MAELTSELQIAIRTALDEAQHRHQEFAGTEHLLLALLCDVVTARAVRRCGGRVDQLKDELDEFLRDSIPRVPDHIGVEAAASVGFHAAIQRAVINAQTSGREVVAGPHVLIAMYALEDCHAVYLLKSQGITRIALMEYVSHGGLQDGLGDDDDLAYSDEPMDADGEDGVPPEQALERFTVNLNIEAAEGRIDPMVGRSRELQRAIHILSRRRKNNPVFVGEAGVGKTAIVEGFARAIHAEEVPESLKNSVVYSLDVGALLAGTRYRGDFENRLKAVVRQLENEPDAVLFVDEIHTLIGAGAASGGAMDASSILKPLLARGKIRCMGATTWKEYRNIFERDAALARRFQKVEVGEPSIDETYEILKGLSEAYSGFHGVTFEDAALREAAALGARYLNDRFLPDKAIDIMDEAAAEVKLDSRDVVTKDDVETTLARMASIPAKQVASDDRSRLAALETDLASVIFGQDKAVKELAAAVKMGRSGLAHPDKPVGSFLFTGPTGVGKTEVCRQLARILGVELIRFDMSEYMERHTVSRLIGAPPGYVGYDQGGLLTDAVVKNPHAVLLLDEIEKAHPDVFNLLLQVMDHGTLTDNNGKKTDFRNVILIMTSNVGARDLQRARPGFASTIDALQGDDGPAFRRLFSPEFRNRLDARIRFEPLKPDVMEFIAKKFVAELAEQLGARDVELDVTDAAIQRLVELGFDPQNGARPMDRAIREHIRHPLADELLFGALADGGRLKVDAKKGEFVFTFPKARRSKKTKGDTKS